MDYGIRFEKAWDEIKESLKQQIASRGVRVSNEMRNSVMTTIRGQGSGRIYRVPMTKRYYQASAPGEVPAVRTGAYRMSWQPSTLISSIGEGEITVISKVESSYRVTKSRLLGDILEHGTSRMAPRPHFQKIQDKAEKKAMKIYREPYF